MEEAVDVIRSESNENIIIHQCPSGYPARLDSVNPSENDRDFKNMFSYPVAFSDHSPGNVMDIAAVSLEQIWLKTITEDRMTRSVEHVMSIEPNEMIDFVKVVREVEIALGSGRLMSKVESKTVL